MAVSVWWPLTRNVPAVCGPLPVHPLACCQQAWHWGGHTLPVGPSACRTAEFLGEARDHHGSTVWRQTLLLPGLQQTMGCLQCLPIKPGASALKLGSLCEPSAQAPAWKPGNLAKTPGPGLGKCQPQPAFPSLALPSPLTPNTPKRSISAAQRSKISPGLLLSGTSKKTPRPTGYKKVHSSWLLGGAVAQHLCAQNVLPAFFKNEAFFFRTG